MNKYSFIILLSVIAASFNSCKKDFLDVPDKSAVYGQEFIKNLSTLESYLSGLYTMVGNPLFNGLTLIYPELVADNVKPAGPGPMSAHYRWTQKATDNISQLVIDAQSTDLNAVWMSGYRIIRASNFVIEKATEYEGENQQKADNIKGQAYALRALIHFMLVNHFAQSYNFKADGDHIGIPYITSSDWSMIFPRVTVSAVYENIIEDLDASVRLLGSTATNPSTLKINVYAAKALLARVYLFKENFSSAKNLAIEVLTAVPLMITNYPANLFTLNESEALFQIAPASLTAASNYGTSFAGRFYTLPRQFIATADIADLLSDSNDVRRRWVAASADIWQVTKFPSNVIEGFNIPSASYYQTVLRSSEMYLTAAEAAARLNEDDEARRYLDAIRSRANPSSLPTTAYGTALLDSIMLERRKELAFEGLRMFDLLRWKSGVNRTDGDVDYRTLSYPSDKAIAPLPQQEITINRHVQNAGY